MSGFTNLSGLRIEGPITTPMWPTPAKSLTALLPWLSVSLSAGRQWESIRVFGGNYGRVRPELLGQQASLSLAHPLLYEGSGPLWALLLGKAAPRVAGVALPEQVSTGVYRHLLEHDEQIQARALRFDEGWAFDDVGMVFDRRYLRRGTVVVATQEGMIEAQSSVARRWRLSGSPAGDCQVEVDWVCSQITSAPTNDYATLQALALPLYDEIVWLDTSIDFAPYSVAAAFAPGDRQEAGGWEISAQRSITVQASRSSGELIEEPRTLAPAEIGLTLRLLYHSTTTHALLLSQLSTATEYRCQITAQGVALGGGYFQTWRLMLPRLALLSVQPALSHGAPAVALECVALTPDEAITWTPAYQGDGRLLLEIINTESAHPLHEGL